MALDYTVIQTDGDTFRFDFAKFSASVNVDQFGQVDIWSLAQQRGGDDKAYVKIPDGPIYDGIENLVQHIYDDWLIS